MDQKGVKPKSKLLKFLTFQNPPFSPGWEKRSENTNKLKTHLGKGFSGPIISIIPAEVRRKSKNLETQEPTSPKVSCMGQVKHKKLCKEFKPSAIKTVPSLNEAKKLKPPGIKTVSSFNEVKKKKTSPFLNIFSGGKVIGGRKSDASANHYKPPLPDRAPSLSQMKRFASGRDTFSNFDWTAQIAAVDLDHRKYYSDEEREDSEGEEDEEVIIPFSAPIMVNRGMGMEPRKEINLWKRRTMPQPKPLQLNTMV